MLFDHLALLGFDAELREPTPRADGMVVTSMALLDGPCSNPTNSGTPKHVIPAALMPAVLALLLGETQFSPFTTSTSSDSFDPASCRAVPVHLKLCLGFFMSWGRKLDILDPSWVNACSL